MKTQNKLAILSAAALIALSSGSVILAKENEKNENKSHQSKLEIKINENEDQKTEINNSRFEIKGIISAIVGNNFVVNGQTIFIDPAQVGKFKQKGLLEINKRVKVEGVIINGVNFAKEIMVIGEGQGRFKFEIKGSLPTSSPTASPSPSSSPTASSSASPTASPTATPSSSPNSSSSATPSAISSANVKVKAIGTIDQVTAFLQQVLNYLKSLV